MTRLVLASGSETRRRMLEAAGVAFDIQPSAADEAAEKARLLELGAGPKKIAGALAELKALSVGARPDTLILGSDQVLEQEDGSILSKPGSREEAAAQLMRLQGRTHRLHSAAVLAAEGAIVWRATETVTLRMRRFGPGFLDRYLAREYDAVRFNAGAYRIEGMGVQLFERIEGSHFAILGMPLIPLLGELRRRALLAS
jgi:septum formation protein